MSNNTGVFGLSGYNDKNLEGLIPDKTRESFREYGYFGGGGSPTTSTIDRIDYSNDTQTASVRGPLSSAKTYLSATGSSNFGYFSGGAPGPVSTVDRIDYSNDTQTASTRGPLSSSRYILAATGNSSFGYFGGGSTNNIFAASVSLIDRINYSNDTQTASTRGPLSSARTSLSAVGNSNFGYFLSGEPQFPAPIFTTVDRINYSNDNAVALVRGPLPDGVRLGAAAGTANFGYYVGGSNPDNDYKSFIRRINYSNDLASPLYRGNLTIATSHSGSSGTGNSNFGYFVTGRTNPVITRRSNIQRIDYANDTVLSSIRGPISRSDGLGSSGTSSHSFGGSPISQYGVFAKPFGYFGGGSVPASVSTIDRIDYANDTARASVRNNLNAAYSVLTAFGNINFGYFCGGQNPSPYTEYSIISRIDYLNDTQSLSNRGNLPNTQYNAAAAGNSNFGYSCGGQFSPIFSIVYRISYSNDLAVALVRGPLSLTRRNFAATGNSNFGYFGGGVSPSTVSTIDRIDYSNDNATASVRGPLSAAILNFAATGNSNFGYFGGGQPGPLSTVNRIDYSNDTATASVRGPLSLARQSLAATGNNNFGYFGGGTTVSTVDRVDYANDTATATTRGPLSSARYALSATSPTAFGGATDFTSTQQFFDIQSMRRIEDTTNYSVKKRALGSYGYFMGGSGSNSNIIRLDYSNETVSIRGPLTSGRYIVKSAGNSNFGYHYGGWLSPGISSTIDRSNYANDLSTALTRINPTPAYRHIGFGNDKFGYFGGGYVSNIFRLDYSNDTSFVSKTTTYSIRRNINSVSNQNFGYFGGGSDATPSQNYYSTIERIDYFNDTIKPLIRGPLSISKSVSGGTGNSNFGYFGGGQTQTIFSISTVDRINYSNDTVTSSVRGPLSLATTTFTATGNANFGYFGPYHKINYNNDLITATTTLSTFSSSGSSATTNARSS